MVAVRVAAIHKPDWEVYLNRIGEITGVSGQFVKVKFTYDARGNKMNDPFEHFFLPGELSML